MSASVAEHDRIPEIALEWIAEGRRAALATVVETWGSAPRPAGSQLVISAEGEIMGSVSGGCVEGAVMVEAMEALEDGACRMLEFGVSNDEAFAVGLACGGRIRVMVEPIGLGQGPSVEDVQALAQARAARRAVAWAVKPETWERALPDGTGEGPLEAAAADRLRLDKSGVTEDGWFLGVHNPPLRLIVVGAVHIAQALIPMARIAGYDPAVVDPREAFASAARFPDTVISHDWPDEALETLGLDARTAVITLTHDAKLDDPAIARALRSPIFYLSCLGSRRTHAKRVERLQAMGFSEAEIARIDSPLGADIGSSTPAEIAISALAQMTERLRRPDTRPGVRAPDARDAA